MADRREFKVKVTVNGRLYERILIDPHFEVRHRESMHDFLVLRLVRELNGSYFSPESIARDGFEIYVVDPIMLNDFPYRLIWTIHPEKDFIGVINAFRRPRGKKED